MVSEHKIEPLAAQDIVVTPHATECSTRDLKAE